MSKIERIMNDLLSFLEKLNCNIYSIEDRNKRLYKFIEDSGKIKMINESDMNSDLIIYMDEYNNTSLNDFNCRCFFDIRITSADVVILEINYKEIDRKIYFTFYSNTNDASIVIYCYLINRCLINNEAKLIGIFIKNK